MSDNLDIAQIKVHETNLTYQTHLSDHCPRQERCRGHEQTDIMVDSCSVIYYTQISAARHRRREI